MKVKRACSFRDFLCGYEDNGKHIKGYHEVALEFIKTQVPCSLHLRWTPSKRLACLV